MRRRISKPPTRTGNHMEDEFLIGTHPDGWRLYQYSTAENTKKKERWVNLKLVAGVSHPGKANFWLAYCLTRMDFGHTRDVVNCERAHPELLLWAERMVLARNSEPSGPPEKPGCSQVPNQQSLAAARVEELF